MKYLTYVFYLEILINLGSISQTLFTPAKFLGTFSSESASTAAIEMTRWYGVLICVLTYLLIRGLQQRGPTLRVGRLAVQCGVVCYGFRDSRNRSHYLLVEAGRDGDRVTLKREPLAMERITARGSLI